MCKMHYMADSDRESLEALQKLLSGTEDVVFSVLIGSRSAGTAQDNSDWDIALRWNPALDWMVKLERTEILRNALAMTLSVTSGKVDIIDLHRANLAMRASVAEEGIPLSGSETLAWNHFLSRTWRELEDYYWEREHAA